MKAFRLLSSPLVHTPGIVKHGLAMDHTSFDPEFSKRLLRIGYFCYTYGVPIEAAIKIVDGDYRVEDNNVIVEVDDETD